MHSASDTQTGRIARQEDSQWVSQKFRRRRRRTARAPCTVRGWRRGGAARIGGVAAAQQAISTGTITGVVQDEQGLPIPGGADRGHQPADAGAALHHLEQQRQLQRPGARHRALQSQGELDRVRHRRASRHPAAVQRNLQHRHGHAEGRDHRDPDRDGRRRSGCRRRPPCGPRCSTRRRSTRWCRAAAIPCAC